jgi:hypothetical protein
LHGHRQEHVSAALSEVKHHISPDLIRFFPIHKL